MLKAVSSISNAIGALNYKGTWNATTNSPALASGVGTKGDYYVVSTAGTTTLDGISNWGIGDWAVFNGSVWQRVEGGADLNGVNLSVTGTTTLSGDVQMSTGNLVVGTSGKGIDFSATPGTGTSELLADYEEGTFTCTMTATTSGTITINSGYRTGKYTKIGRQVNVCGFLVIDSVSSPVGAAIINGLPFACGPNDSNLSAASFEIRSSAFPAGASVQGRVESNQTGFLVFAFISGTVAQAAGYITGGTQITFNLTYFTS